MIKPSPATAWFPQFHPLGSDRTPSWPYPAEVLAAMDRMESRVPGIEEQFGRYPGMSYEVPRDDLRLADPTPVLRPPVPTGYAS